MNRAARHILYNTLQVSIFLTCIVWLVMHHG